MEITDFSVGAIYRMTIVPYLDCEPGEETIKVLTVLSPATAENSRTDDCETVAVPSPADLDVWGKFLRIRDEKGNVRLQAPSLVISAERVASADDTTLRGFMCEIGSYGVGFSQDPDA